MRSVQNEEGSALVEFALSSVVLFMTLFGLMASCTALYSYLFVAEADKFPALIPGYLRFFT